MVQWYRYKHRGTAVRTVQGRRRDASGDQALEGGRVYQYCTSTDLGG